MVITGNIENTVFGLSVYDALSTLMDAREREEVRKTGLEQCLPFWFDPSTGGIRVSHFFYGAGLQRHNYPESHALRDYLQALSRGDTPADMLARITEEHASRPGREVLGLNTLLVWEASKLCNFKPVLHSVYLLAESRVARSVGKEVFQRLWSPTAIPASSSPKEQTYLRIFHDYFLRRIDDLITVGSRWEREVSYNEDGSLSEDSRRGVLFSQDRFFDPSVLEKVNVLYLKPRIV